MKFEKEYFGFYLFAFILPLPLPLYVSSFAMTALVINCLLLLKKPIQIDLLTVVFALFFLSDFIALVFSGRSFNANTIINDVKISCILLPILVYNIRIDIKEIRKGVFGMFTMGVLIYVLYCALYYIYFIQTHPRYTVQIDQYLFWTIENNFPGTYHRTYIGAYLVLSSLFVSKEIFRIRSLSKKVLLSFLFVLHLAAIFFLGSKLTMALFLPLNVLILLKYYKVLVIPFVVSVGLGFFLIREWIFNSLEKSFFDRSIFFEKSLEIIRDNLLFGIGEKNITKYSVLIYEEITELIPHNVFLKETLSNGVLGLGFLFILLTYIVYMAWRSDKLIFRCFVFLIVSISLIEDFIYMQRGLFLFVFFSTIFINNKKGQPFWKN